METNKLINHQPYHSAILNDTVEQNLFSLGSLLAAKERPVYRTGKKLRVGINSGNDETALWVVYGSNIVLSNFLVDADPRSEIVQTLNTLRPQLERVNVDSIGIGCYLALYLEDLDFPVNSLNLGLSANDSNEYFNLKSEMYWGLRMRAIYGDINGPLDDVTIAQLLEIRYHINSRGQKVIESKEHAKKRGVRFFDRAAGLMLAFATIPSMYTSVNFI